MNRSDVPKLYRLSDAVKLLGPGSPSEDTLRRAIKRGELQAKRIGRCVCVIDEELTRWLRDTTSPAGPVSTPEPPSAQADATSAAGPAGPIAAAGGEASDFVPFGGAPPAAVTNAEAS